MCCDDPKSKSAHHHHHLIKSKRGKEQVSSYIFVVWCKWEKKLEGIIKMSLAFHLKKTQEMRKEVRKKKTHHHIHANRTSRFFSTIRKCFVFQAPAVLFLMINKFSIDFRYKFVLF
jgi:hypothetical protein